MKNKVIYLCMLFVFAALLPSCSDDEASPRLTGYEASKLDHLPMNVITLEVPEKGTNPMLFSITWTETFFFLDNSTNATPAGPVSYSLHIDKEGNQFANYKTLAASTELYTDLLVSEFNSFLLKQFEAVPGIAEDYELRIEASYGAGNVDQVIFSSNTLPLTVTPYNPPLDITPIYIIGDMQGWNNNDKSFMMFRNNSDGSDYEYTYTGRIAANTYFKFCPESGLGAWDKMYCKGDNGTLVVGDLDAFVIETEGYYTFTINVDAMTYTIEQYDASSAKTWDIINFVGAFSEWGATNEPDMIQSEYDPHQWSLEIELNNIEYGVKFRANHGWDDKWCPSDPNAQPYGVAEYNPSGHDNNIDITSQGLGNYLVRFNDLTGHYIVVIQ